MVDPDIQERLDFSLKILDQMSEYQNNFSASEMKLERKSDLSPVTVADKQSEKMFRDAVKERFPDDRIFGEEEGGASGGTRWVIDPIDGTRKFIRGMPFWGILIAFEVDSVVELGAMAVPGRGEKWWATREGGAFRDGQPIRVDSSNAPLDQSFLTMPSRKFFTEIGEERYFDDLQERIEHDPGFLDAYSYGFVGDGRLHGLLSCGDKWWDIAAMVCIIEEAGGKFTDLKGGRAEEGALNIAACPRTHELILKWAEKLRG